MLILKNNLKTLNISEKIDDIGIGHKLCLECFEVSKQ